MTEPSAPTVSVIVPTHDRADLLPRAVSSVLDQTYTDFEIIVVDDASTDETRDVIAGFTDPRIRSIRREQSGGTSAARNAGISVARGEYMAFLDDDDEWLPYALENLLSILEATPSTVGLVYGWLDVVEDSSGRRRPGKRSMMSGDISNELLALNVPAQTSAWLVLSAAVRELGGGSMKVCTGETTRTLCAVSPSNTMWLSYRKLLCCSTPSMGTLGFPTILPRAYRTRSRSSGIISRLSLRNSPNAPMLSPLSSENSQSQR